MIDKLIIDNVNIELSDKDKMPYTYNFSTAKTHVVKYALSDTNEVSAGAFANCSYMTKVKFPPEIKMIKRRAFENCVRLDNVVIPKTIEYIGANVWTGCTGMKEMRFEANVPPANSSEIPTGCKVYIPNDSKYVLEEGSLDPDNNIYYSKTNYGMYVEVPAASLEKDGTYYKDNWVTIAPNAVTIEEKNRIPVEEIEFAQTNISINVAGDENTKQDDEILRTINYSIKPDNSTNRKLYFFASNTDPKAFIKIYDTEKEGELVLSCAAKRQSSMSITVYAESGAHSTINISTAI